MTEEELVLLTRQMILDTIAPKWVKDAKSYMRSCRAAIEEAQRHLDRMQALIESHEAADGG